ncbi:MAG: TIGR03546 family protein [Deltaproteobacteria bacterium]|nr:TIGR03546 family protein [Deltaproteobacteria bacterium]
MFLLRPLFHFFELIRKESSPFQLAAGVIMGIYLGLIPMLSLQWVFFLICVIIFRINVGMTLISFPIFWALSDPLTTFFDHVGFHMLTHYSMFRWLMAGLYHAPLIPFTRFNNSIVLGATLTALAVSVPIFTVLYLVFKKQGSNIFWAVVSTNFSRTLYATRVFRIYDQYRQTPR